MDPDTEPARTLTGARHATAGRVVAFAACLAALCAVADAQVLSGADVLFRDSLRLVAGKRVGVLCNRASVLANGTHLLDTLRALPDVRLVAVFAPEHGFDADLPAGAYVPVGRRASLPVYTLYGARRSPAASMLSGLDVLLVDLQDAGARYYTYASTAALCMRACARAGVRVVVLDRPNPVTGRTVEGPVLDTALASFVGMFPVPVRHGMTMGELLRMAAGEGWCGAGVPPPTVVPLAGWHRGMWFDETGLRWIPPSPNLPRSGTALLYLAACVFEGTNVSEGRGTGTPFGVFGMPLMDAERVAAACTALDLPGVAFRAARFIPRDSGAIAGTKFPNAACEGAAIDITDRDAFRPVAAGLSVLAALLRTYPERVRTTKFLDRLIGKPDVAARLRAGASPGDLDGDAGRAVEAFREKRRGYLLYHDD